MNSLLRICMAFLFFQSVAALLLKLNGCKFTPANMLLFECMPENLTFESSANSVMIYFWPAHNHDEGDYIVLCRKVPLQAVFNCSQPKPPYKWTPSKESCLLKSGDPNSCLKVTANKSIAVVGNYSCKIIPEHTESEKCLYSYNNKDATELSETGPQTLMTNTQATEIPLTMQTHSDGDSEITLSQEGIIALTISSILIVMVSATVIFVCLVQRKVNCRNCFFNQGSLNKETQNTDVENSCYQNEHFPERNKLLQEKPTNECRQAHISAWPNSSSILKETSVNNVSHDLGHMDRSSERTQSFNDATPIFLNRGGEAKTDANADPQYEFLFDGGEPEMLLNKDTNDDLDVHYAPINTDKKEAVETACCSIKNEGRNAPPTERCTYISKDAIFTIQGTILQATSEKLLSIDLPRQNLMKATLTAAHTKNDQANFQFEHQTNNTSMNRAGQDTLMLHADTAVTVPGDMTASNYDKLISEQTDDKDLATDGEDWTMSPPTFMRQSSVSAVEESEHDEDTNKNTFTFEDHVWMDEAEKVLGYTYYGAQRLEVEDLLKQIHDIMDELANYAAFLKSGEEKNIILENWVEKMDILARRKEKQLHDKMKEIRESKAEATVNDIILKRAHLHLNQLTINSVTDEPSNFTSAANSIGQFNIGLRKKSPTETIVTKNHDTDSQNYSEEPDIKRTRVTQSREGERQIPDLKRNTIGYIEEVLKKKITMSVSVPRDSYDSTSTDTHNRCNEAANKDNKSAHSVKGASADGRMLRTCGRTEFHEDHANAPWKIHVLYHV